MTKKICQNCNQRWPNEMNFCPKCGSEVEHAPESPFGKILDPKFWPALAFVGLLLFTAFKDWHRPSTVDQNPTPPLLMGNSSTLPYTADRFEESAPKSQIEFLNLLEKGRIEFAGAPTQALKSYSMTIYKSELCKYLKKIKSIKNWRGRVTDVNINKKITVYASSNSSKLSRVYFVLDFRNEGDISKKLLNILPKDEAVFNGFFDNLSESGTCSSIFESTLSYEKFRTDEFDPYNHQWGDIYITLIAGNSNFSR